MSDAPLSDRVERDGGRVDPSSETAVAPAAPTPAVGDVLPAPPALVALAPAPPPSVPRPPVLALPGPAQAGDTPKIAAPDAQAGAAGRRLRTVVAAMRRATDDGAEDLRLARRKREAARFALPQTKWCDVDRPFRLSAFYEGATAGRSGGSDRSADPLGVRHRSLELSLTQPPAPGPGRPSLRRPARARSPIRPPEPALRSPSDDV